MAIQDKLANAIQRQNVPIDVIPDNRVGGVGYGQELIGRANPTAGVYQYGKGPSTYSRIAPGTKTKALRDYEAAKKAEEERAKLEAAMVEMPSISTNKKTGFSSKGNAPPSSGASGTVKQWLLEALELTGQDQSLLPYLETMAMKESSGRPDAINLWDSNAKKGTPSKGILQTIDSTFNAHKLPGHDDIWNPVDNAAAAIRYAISRYGSLENVPGIKSMSKGGKYVGY